MWLQTTARVEGVTPDHSRSSASPTPVPGGIATVTYRAPARSHTLPPEHVHGAVLADRRKHLIVPLQTQGSRDRVQALGRVRCKDEVARIRAQIRGQRRLRLVDQLRIAPKAREEIHRLPLELELEPLVLLENRTRARAERSVVEVDDAGVKQEQVAQARAHPRKSTRARSDPTPGLGSTHVGIRIYLSEERLVALFIVLSFLITFLCTRLYTRLRADA